jgi:hypothetical protein
MAEDFAIGVAVIPAQQPLPVVVWDQRRVNAEVKLNTARSGSRINFSPGANDDVCGNDVPSWDGN